MYIFVVQCAMSHDWSQLLLNSTGYHWIKLESLQLVLVPTVDSEHVLDLLLDDLECHLDPVGVGHGVDLVGVELVDVQDLRRRERIIGW